MAVTTENGSNSVKQSFQSVNNNHNLNIKNACSAILKERPIPVQVKKKRGRPRKIILMNENEIPAALESNENSVDSNSSTGTKSKGTPTIDKKCPGRLISSDISHENLAETKSGTKLEGTSTIVKRGRSIPISLHNMKKEKSVDSNSLTSTKSEGTPKIVKRGPGRPSLHKKKENLGGSNSKTDSKPEGTGTQTIVKRRQGRPVGLNMRKNNSVESNSITGIKSGGTPTIVKRGPGRPSLHKKKENLGGSNSKTGSKPEGTGTLTIVKRRQGRPVGLNMTKKKSAESNSLTDSKPKSTGALTIIKRRRGRPIGLNMSSKISTGSNSLTGQKCEDIVTPTIVKRRGRPKKNGILANITQTPHILSNTATPKKRERKKGTHSQKNPKKIKMSTLEIKNIMKVSNNSKSSKSEMKPNSDITKKKNKVPSSTMLTNANSISNESEVNHNTNIVPGPVYYLKCVTLERYDSPEFMSNTKIKIEPGCESEENIFSELNEVNWDLIPIRTRTRSVTEYSKKRIRRNSLPDSFVYTNSESTTAMNEYNVGNLIKPWKSLSYIVDGPNALTERLMYKELDKKFRLKLKRSRSFPSCMLLDTITWRYLVRQQKSHSRSVFYDSDDDKSDTDSYLTNEFSDNDDDDIYNHQYRSKSVPIELSKHEMEKKSLKMYRSLENLNSLCCTNNLPITSFQIPSQVCDLNNVVDKTEKKTEEVDKEEECGSKIRRSKRLHIKLKRSDMLEEEHFLNSDVPKFDYLLLAEQIRKENERQLSEARQNDPQLDEKLSKLNFTLITNNMFRPHRKNMNQYSPEEATELRKLKQRKILNSETSYMCHCTYSRKDFLERKPGCSSECINRILNIECGANCSLKGFCTNKQFQNKQFKRTEIGKTSDKGYGVFALEDIPSGAFVDEYMGEVIDQNEMIKRMETDLYRNNNYMVQLKHDEIIDATCKGNITRFINHSCNPNCVAEKWNVLGESRMGFFCNRLVKKGEEITFDYSFEIFGGGADQKCYCGSSKCRGYISKKPRAGDQSSSDDECDEIEENIQATKLEECSEKKKKIKIKRISNKDKKRLKELDKQLTDISQLKNKNRTDSENSTLNLNKLMVHITDSMSQSHILKFIRDNDLKCKRLFMNYNGLSIIHSWMSSTNNEPLKLEIIETLSELPILNRNTITKSKVLEIVAEWANIPKSVKEVIENLEYPVSKILEHSQEVDSLLPEEAGSSSLVQAARNLWKKWIILKMVFKIPKLDRPKEVNTPSVVNESSVLPQSKPESNQYYFGNLRTYSNQHAKINHGDIKNKFNSKHVQGNEISKNVKTNSIETFSKMINHQNLINTRHNTKAIFEWKKNTYSKFKSFSGNNSTEKNTYLSGLNSKHSSTSTFRKINVQHEIPTIECGKVISQKPQLNTTSESNSPGYKVPAEMVSVSTNNTLEKIKPDYKYYPIEEIITNQNVYSPPTITDFHNVSAFNFILNMPPPCYVANQHLSHMSSGSIMRPENVFYDAQHPSIEEQIISMSEPRSIKSSYQIDTSEIEYIATEKNDRMMLQKTNRKKKLLKHNENSLKKSHTKVDKPSKFKNSNKMMISKLGECNIITLKPTKENIQNKLFKQCQNNINKLYETGALDLFKLSKTNLVNQLPIKITTPIKNKHLTSHLHKPNSKKQVTSFPDLLRVLKIGSNCYQEQLSNTIKINNSKSIDQKIKNDIFRIKENNSSEKMNTSSLALKYHNENLISSSRSLNIGQLFNKQTVQIKTENKFAFKILNSFFKKCSTMSSKFTLKVPQNNKMTTIDPNKEIELHHKLIPTIKNTLCAKFNRENPRGVINVFKQNMIMKYNDNSQNSGSDSEENPDSLKKVEMRKTIQQKSLKRKMPLPKHNTKTKKLDGLLSVKDKNVTRNQIRPASQTSQARKTNISKQITPIVDMYKRSTKEIKLKRSIPSHTIQSGDLIQSNEKLTDTPSTSTQVTQNYNESRQKPLMKCSPFYKVNNISTSELEQNALQLATSLSMSCTDDVLLSAQINNELIPPIIDNFNNSISSIRTTSRTNLTDDPIVRDYILHTQMKKPISKPGLKRKCKLPESMMSLPSEVLNLVPDNQREIKYVIDFYHAMATVIVKVLDAYVKKSCKQGRIKSDEDFKFLAKKLNSNILFKELQAKRVEDLKITDSVKQKVEQYIIKYMLKFGKVYKRKNQD